MEDYTSRLNCIGEQLFDSADEAYKIVDFLNKTLKDRGFIFGIRQENTSENRDGDSWNKYSIHIYEV